MIISERQFEYLNSAFIAEAARRIGRFIDANCDLAHPYDGSRPLPPGPARESAILSLVTRARRDFGIQCERGMTQFVVLGLGYSRDFYEIDEVRYLLSHWDLPAGQRIQNVIDRVVKAEVKAR